MKLAGADDHEQRRGGYVRPARSSEKKSASTTSRIVVWISPGR